MLLGVLALATGVRLYGLGEADFWLDEIHTLTATAGNREAFEGLPHATILPDVVRFTDMRAGVGPADVWRTLRADSHPPLYFVIHQAWRRVAGDTEFLARLPAAVFSVLAIVPVALILYEYRQALGAVVTATLLAVGYAHIHMAQQCRPYSLGMLFVALSYWILVRMQSRGASNSKSGGAAWMAGHALVTYGAVLTHYFTVLPLLGQVLYVVWRVRGRLLRAWCLSVSVAAVAFAVTWGPSIGAQIAFTKAHTWLLEQGAGHVVRTILRAADLPIRLLFMHDRFAVSAVRSLLGGLVLGAALFVLYRSRVRGTAVFVAWYFGGTIALIAIDMATDRQTLTHTRYISVLAPGLAGLFGLAFQVIARPVRLALAAVTLVMVLATLRLPTQSNPHNRVAAQAITDRLAPSTLLVFDAIDWQPFWVSQMYHNVAYYLCESPLAQRTPVVLLRRRPDEALRRRMAEYDRLVVVSPRIDGTPNPAPARYRMTDRTAYVFQIGVIYVFERIKAADRT